MVTTASTTSEGSVGIVKGASIVSFVLAFLMPVVGLVGSIAMLIWSKRAGASTRLPVWGILVSIVMIIVTIVVALIALSLFTSAANAGAVDIQALCAHRDQWGWLIDSLRYVCR